MSQWISLHWVGLLPVLAALTTLARLRAAYLARRRGLLTPSGWAWMLAALAAAQALIVLTQLAVVFQTSLGLPAAGLAAIGLLAFALRAARAEVHPGLHGFQRPLPRDGLALIEREQLQRRDPLPLRWALRPWLTLLPAIGLTLYLGAYHPLRWLEFALLAMTLTAPALATPFRRQWLAPLLLVPPVGLLLAQAASLRAELPPGRWSAPVTGARCPSGLRVAAPSARAWCVDAFEGVVYQFDLRTGLVRLRRAVPEAAQIFAATERAAWVQRIPARGLVRVSAEAAESVRVGSAVSGAAGADGRLWVIDVGQDLTLVPAAGEPRFLSAADGLLNNTANVVKVSPEGDVWVGSIGGVSWLRAGSTEWQTLSRAAGLPGAVVNISFAPQRAVWLLWRARPGYGALSDWGVSLLTPGGLQDHVALGPPGRLEPPRSEDALAVDGLGRLWFVTQSTPRREKILGVVSPEVGAPLALYSLGQFSSSGPYGYPGTGLWQNAFGVVADGQGGIILYNGEAQPWRVWNP